MNTLTPFQPPNNLFTSSILFVSGIILGLISFFSQELSLKIFIFAMELPA
jgi:hypothetical protein